VWASAGGEQPHRNNHGPLCVTHRNHTTAQGPLVTRELRHACTGGRVGTARRDGVMHRRVLARSNQISLALFDRLKHLILP
jgi:hypothetical protein